ncbi:MAG: hypothetical protein Q8936_05930 [Bacillota bacterium]|nr:hypothetical protein [Bacillota bacterium]
MNAPATRVSTPSSINRDSSTYDPVFGRLAATIIELLISSLIFDRISPELFVT